MNQNEVSPIYLPRPRFWTNVNMKVRRQAMKRDKFVDMKSAWGDNPDRLEVAQKISCIIADYCVWRSKKFIPDDQCAALLSEYCDGMEVAEAVMEIEGEYNVPDCVMDNIFSYTLGELVDYIVQNPPSPEYREKRKMKPGRSDWKPWLFISIFALIIVCIVVESRFGTIAKTLRLAYVRYTAISSLPVWLITDIIVRRRKNRN